MATQNTARSDTSTLPAGPASLPGGVPSVSRGTSLDITRLENVKEHGQKTTAVSPACRRKPICPIYRGGQQVPGFLDRNRKDSTDMDFEDKQRRMIIPASSAHTGVFVAVTTVSDGGEAVGSALETVNQRSRSQKAEGKSTGAKGGGIMDLVETEERENRFPLPGWLTEELAHEGTPPEKAAVMRFRPVRPDIYEWFPEYPGSDMAEADIPTAEDREQLSGQALIL
jgi:hypothetical protein